MAMDRLLMTDPLMCAFPLGMTDDDTCVAFLSKHSVDGFLGDFVSFTHPWLVE